jgi:hypothetical protein
MKENFNIKLQKIRTAGFVKLFEYVSEVSKIIGEEKAWKLLEKVIIQKRDKWFNKNKGKLNFEGCLIDQAYNIFYLKYFNLNPEDVEIIEKTENKLITRWRIYCPVLEACKILGLDTRKVCKEAYHKPVQAFLNKISPNLKFSRNYEKIRPYNDYCEEIIEVIK